MNTKERSFVHPMSRIKILIPVVAPPYQILSILDPPHPGHHLVNGDVERVPHLPLDPHPCVPVQQPRQGRRGRRRGASRGPPPIRLAGGPPQRSSS